MMRIYAIQGLEYQLKWRPWQGGQVMFNQTYTESVQRFMALAPPMLRPSWPAPWPCSRSCPMTWT